MRIARSFLRGGYLGYALSSSNFVYALLLCNNLQVSVDFPAILAFLLFPSVALNVNSP